MHPDSHLIFLVVLLLALMVLGPPVVGAATGTILGALHARKVQQPTGPAKMKGAILGGLIGIAVVFVGWSVFSVGITSPLYAMAGAVIGGFVPAVNARKLGRRAIPASTIKGAIIGGFIGLGLAFFGLGGRWRWLWSEGAFPLLIAGTGVTGAAIGGMLLASRARASGHPTRAPTIKGALIGGICGSGIGIVILWSLLK
jgi:hypothetical protein